ncbi:MAG: hypothetical protein J0H73_14880 [Salana multivorans]|uniref:hypothetical protein n=1 Tax=Salana multivorans TaxID=120377 RepID=UPI000966870B|nr:hypothetical protein [Salana multivorans]MBN8883583.1 hypothetical protein [Salana multivorans]OJX97052.1 MAG: hypothetical protein BGO96_03115 [Micrococcales bacterium 73-15]
MSDMWWSRGVGCGLVVVLAVGLVACRGGEEPTPAPSGSGASPTVEASPSLDATVDEQELIDEAIAALTEYLALANEVENAGGEGVEVLEPLLQPDFYEQAQRQFGQLVEHGWHTTGTSFISEIRESVLDPSLESIRLSYCIDASNVTATDNQGNPVADEVAEPFLAEASLVRIERKWLIENLATHRSQPC